MNGLKLKSLSKNASTLRGNLIGEVTPDHALAGVGIVGRADAGQQQHMHVEQLKGAEQHQVGRLLPFLAVAVDIGDAGRALAGGVEIDAA